MHRITLYFQFACLVVLLSLINSCIYSQSASIKFSSNLVDFGNVATVMHPVKTVEFTNISNQKLAILVVEKGPNVIVGFQRRFFEPGEKGLISLKYEAGTLGDFREQIKIYTNIDVDPSIITLKGKCITLEECFPNKANLSVRNILVVNKLTQAPIPMANVTFIHNFNKSKAVTCKMDKDGKAIKELPIGQYNAQSAMNGYDSYNLDFFLPRSQPNIVIELNPKKVEAPTPPVVNPPITINKPREDIPVDPVITSTELPEDKYAANNIVLLLDVSSSMLSRGKFTLLQQSVNNLIMALRSIDNVTIITYAGDAKVVLSGIPGNEKEKIMGAVQDLKAYGSTHGVKGLNTAYELAGQKYINKGNNQIILATDGEFSEKSLTDEYYQQFISGYAAKGIKLSILGFGVNEGAINRMKKMTTSGEGTYIHIASEKYVKDALIKEIKAMSFMEQANK